MEAITKALQISPEIHKQLKEYCDERGLKIHKLVERLILSEIKSK